MSAGTVYAKGDKPSVGEYFGFHHVEFWCGNAKQAASFYTSRFGFNSAAYRGLETGNRDRATHVVAQGDIKFAFTTTYSSEDAEFNKHISTHGDGARVVAFSVDDAAGIWKYATEHGAESVEEPHTVSDENGSVVIAGIKTYGDTIHRFIQNVDYTGPFLPGYGVEHIVADPLNEVLKPIGLEFIDHCVGNQPDAGMIPAVEFYEKTLQFHRFWSVDDKEMHTEFSALRSTVMASYSEKVKMPINEPAPGKRKSQIQEYVEFYSGAGVQHIALRTESILESIANLRARGVTFLTIPKTYYTQLRERLAKSPVDVTEDLDTIERLNILVDFDDAGYLLQIFTKPCQDRPTFFLEIIQRRNHEGFGAGNFKALFESIEIEQGKRGNL